MAKEEEKEEGNEGREVDFGSKLKVADGGACGEGDRETFVEGCKSSLTEDERRRGRERISPSFRSPSPRPHPSFIHVSPGVPRSPLSPFGVGEGIRARARKGGGCTTVRERATPRMTQVPQSLTRLRLFCHLLLSFELFYRLPR